MKMRYNSLLLFLFLGLTTLVYTGCDDDDPTPPNEEEVITTVTLVLTPNTGGDVVTLSWLDADGNGALPPVITGGTLQANTEYTTVATFFNAIENENVTEEVLEEALEHQVFYGGSGIDLTVQYNDMDSEGNPIGLSATITTGDAASGDLTLILVHEPNKGATGVAEGNPANAGGSRDVDVAYPMTIQ